MTKQEATAWLTSCIATAYRILVDERNSNNEFVREAARQIKLLSVNAEEHTDHPADPAVVMTWYSPSSDSDVVFTWTPDRRAEVRDHDGDGGDLWEDFWPTANCRPELASHHMALAFVVASFIRRCATEHHAYMQRLWDKAGGRAVYNRMLDGL